MLADKGEYLTSESTMYRLLKKNKCLAPRGIRKLPEIRLLAQPIATQPNRIWSWDITYLRTSTKGIFYYLYLVLDVYSRKIVGWNIYTRECSILATNFIKETILKNQADTSKLRIHSDNGAPMKSHTMIETLKLLGVIQTLSRPAKSNDNPFSESLFKTIKYTPQFPYNGFNLLDDAKEWMIKFVAWYNKIHLHSGIKFVTPEARHNGSDQKILEQRKMVYEKARLKKPYRWSKNIRNWMPIKEVSLTYGKKNKNAA